MWKTIVMARVYPYFLSFEKLPEIFTKIRSAGVPKKFTFRFFASLGFSSSNDRGFVTILRTLGFIDAKGNPTDLYLRLRDHVDFKQVLREQIRLIYKDLFVIDTKVDNQPVLYIKNVFSNITHESDKIALVYAQTFKSFCLVAGLSSSPPETFPTVVTDVSGNTPSRNPKVNYNININLPDTTDPDVLEALFKGLKDVLK